MSGRWPAWRQVKCPLVNKPLAAFIEKVEFTSNQQVRQGESTKDGEFSQHKESPQQLYEREWLTDETSFQNKCIH